MGGDGADASDMLGCHAPCQQGHDVARLALTVDPLGIVFGVDRREFDLLIELRASEQHLFEHIGSVLTTTHFHQNAERQSVVDHRLANVQNVHV